MWRGKTDSSLSKVHFHVILTAISTHVIFFAFSKSRFTFKVCPLLYCYEWNGRFILPVPQYGDLIKMHSELLERFMCAIEDK